MGLLANASRRQSLLNSPSLKSYLTCRLFPARCFHIDSTAESSSDLALLLAKYSQQPPRPLTLNKLLSFGSPLTRDSLLESASYALSEIPRRLVSRVRALEALPFIVTTNPFLSRTLRAYRAAFETLATHSPVKDLDENWAFAQQLEGLVADHANDIPTMAKGFQECARYMSSTDISAFLDRAIRNRVGVRLIAEQHIALSRALRESPAEILSDGGVVDTECSPAQMVRMCAKFVTDLCEATLGSSPPLLIDGDINTTFAYVPVHLEFALTELLKNAFRATVEHHYKVHGHDNSTAIPPVIVTIAAPSVTSVRARTSHLSMRIRDQGGGVSPTNLPFIFSYAFTTTGKNNIDTDDEIGGGPYAAQYVGGSAAIGGDPGPGEANLFGEITNKGLQTGMGTLSGLGYGLPLAKLYATYFGGDLQLVSLYNHGTDVFLKLRCLQPEDSAVIS
ncbi:branched-chain alpha-ketoacid dehydrogenase [Hysterangium stoloniferum]|nr:branched-chain alpha-ketoacid dehydrogenase [Hysterangium stoloniferum]